MRSLRSAKATWLRRLGVLAAVAAAAAVAVSVGAAPAGATIRFCTATVCIGSPNGCNTQTTKGVVIMVDDGDSFIAADGRKWTCVHGSWVVALTSGFLQQFGPTLGLGLIWQGPPPPSTCDLSPTFSEVVAACVTIELT